MDIGNILNRKLFFWLSLLIILYYLSPLLLIGDLIHITVFDNLDGSMVHYKILGESGYLFANSDTIIPNILNGIPRAAFGSEFDLLAWFYILMKPFHAYVLNEFIIHGIAFISMYLFLSKKLFENESDEMNFISSLVGALYFAMTPFLPSLGLSIAIMPLMVLILINIHAKQEKWWEWLILILIPLYTSFPIVYVFFIFSAGVFYASYAVKTKSIQINFLIALAVVILLFLLKEYRLVVQMLLGDGFISHRTEFSNFDKDFLDAYRMGHSQFIFGVTHAKGMQYDYLLPLAMFAFFSSLINKKYVKFLLTVSIIFFVVLYFYEMWSTVWLSRYSMIVIVGILLIGLLLQKDQSGYRLILALLFLVVVSFWLGFSFYYGWNSISAYLPFIKMFDISRFFFFSQPLWAIVAALAVLIILKKVKYSKIIILFFVVLQIQSAKQNAYFGNENSFTSMSYKRYFSKDLYDEIQRYINKPIKSYKVVSLGVDPSIALYNGFHTLDGYMVNYPLAYKHEFRRVISDYLAVDPGKKHLYDDWGNRVYMYDENIRFIYTNSNEIEQNKKKTYTKLYLNTKELYRIGGRYLFSARKIVNAQKYNLKFLKNFMNLNSMWFIHLYEIQNPEFNQ